MTELKEAVYKETSYTLSLDCTYRNFTDLAKEVAKSNFTKDAILREKINSNTLELVLQPLYVDPDPRISPIDSFVFVIEKLSTLDEKPLRLKATHFWYFEKDRVAGENFIAIINKHFGYSMAKQAEEPKATLPKNQGGREPYPEKPWEKIPDNGLDRSILELFHSGISEVEIGKKLSYSRVKVRLSELRKQFGDHIVPFAKDIKKMIAQEVVTLRNQK